MFQYKVVYLTYRKAMKPKTKTAKMTYTQSQIERAKKAYNNFLMMHTLSDYEVDAMGRNEAEERMHYHNGIVEAIKSGDKAVEREWKLFFLKEEVKADTKKRKSNEKAQANKEASADVIAPIKKMRKLGAFGKWLNTSGNEFRKQHFNKKYTQEAVDAFLATL